MKTTSISKIIRPDVSCALHRERLFSLLDGCLDRPVTFLSGPGGSGKTTLVSSYIDSRKLQSIWYRIDEGDSDISTFFYYMGLAVKAARPGIKRPLPLLTPEYLPGLPTFSRRYFEELYKRLSGRGEGKRFVIVLDNYQDVPDNSEFHDVILGGLSVVPPEIRVILLSRHKPPSQFVRLWANERMSFVGWDDIRFTLDEIRGVPKIKAGDKFDEARLRQIYEMTDGWIAGLVLVAEVADRKAANLEVPEDFDRQDIFDYFARELFGRLDEEMKGFLVQTALFPQMTAKMAGRLTGNARSADILSDLCRNNCFTDQRTLREPVYQYHPLFREFLLSMPDKMAAEIKPVRRDAAALLEEAGYIEDAANCFIGADEWEGLARLVLENAGTLIGQGRGRTLEGWLKCLPASMIDESPWLIFYLGVCNLPGRPLEARDCFEKAFHLFEARGDSSGILSAWCRIIETFLFSWKDFQLLDKWIEWFDSHVDADIKFPDRALELSAACSRSDHLVLLRQPGDPGIRKWIGRALQLSADKPDIWRRLQACCTAQAYNIWYEDVFHFAALNREIREIGLSPAAPPIVRINARWLEAISRSLLLPPSEEPLALLREGMEIAEESGVYIFNHFLFGFSAYACLKSGDIARAGEFLEKMEDALRKASQTTSQFHYFSAWHMLLSGDKPSALRHARTSVEMLADEGLVFPEIVARLALAQTLHEMGDYDEAAPQLDLACKMTSESGSKFLRFRCLLVKAQFDLDRGMEESGLDHLKKGMKLGSKHCFLTLPWWWQPKVMAMLCSKALENGIEVEYVREIMMKQRLAPVPSLSEKEKEVLSWMVHGKSNWEIAQILGVSERTAKFHVENVIKKLKAVNRAQAVAIAVREKLV